MDIPFSMLFIRTYYNLMRAFRTYCTHIHRIYFVFEFRWGVVPFYDRTEVLPIYLVSTIYWNDLERSPSLIEQRSPATSRPDWMMWITIYFCRTDLCSQRSIRPKQDYCFSSYDFGEARLSSLSIYHSSLFVLFYWIDDRCHPFAFSATIDWNHNK